MPLLRWWNLPSKQQLLCHRNFEAALFVQYLSCCQLSTYLSKSAVWQRGREAAGDMCACWARVCLSHGCQPSSAQAAHKFLSCSPTRIARLAQERLPSVSRAFLPPPSLQARPSAWISDSESKWAWQSFSHTAFLHLLAFFPWILLHLSWQHFPEEQKSYVVSACVFLG